MLPARLLPAFQSPARAGAAAATASRRFAAASGGRHFAAPNEELAPSMPERARVAVERENRYGAHNYHPIPVVIESGSGVLVKDVAGKTYYDFLSAYSAVNQGHCHPRIIKALVDQSHKLTITSRAFYNDVLGEYEEFMCNTLGFDRLLPANSGVEAAEAAVKFARRWAYDVKGVPKDCATVIMAKENFWGRTISAVSSSTDPSSYSGFGPLTPGFRHVPFDDLEALKEAVKDPHVAAFMVEPIQGEAGVVVPRPGYMREAKRICKENGVLLIADEIQTGLGRTGKLVCCDHDDVRPDIMTLGKALSGGVLPVSAMMASSEVMLNVRPGEHGSTFGGNPLACRVAMAAVRTLIDEKMVENSATLGDTLLRELQAIQQQHPDVVRTVRGRGLFAAVVIEPRPKTNAWDVCMRMKDLGMLAKPTHGDIIRLAPPLVINGEQLRECLAILRQALEDYAADRIEPSGAAH